MSFYEQVVGQMMMKDLIRPARDSSQMMVPPLERVTWERRERKRARWIERERGRERKKEREREREKERASK